MPRRRPRALFLADFPGTFVPGLVALLRLQPHRFRRTLFPTWKMKKRQVRHVGLVKQLNGPTPPFWLLPSLCGRQVRPAPGRPLSDRNMVTINAEQRFTVWDVKMAGVAQEIQWRPSSAWARSPIRSDPHVKRYARPVMGDGHAGGGPSASRRLRGRGHWARRPGHFHGHQLLLQSFTPYLYRAFRR